MNLRDFMKKCFIGVKVFIYSREIRLMKIGPGYRQPPKLTEERNL